MTFGEKLKLLLKENNMSQENLAEHLDVSRQAVGKWVNDKGIPEVEKIVQISNIFNVSLDYLLKDNIEEKNNSNKKYYVSKEMLDKYLSYKQKRTAQIALGITFILLSIAFDILEYNNIIKNILYWLSLLSGLILVIIYFFQTKQYEEIKHNEIVIDKDIFEDFQNQKEFKRKKYILVVIISVVIFLLSSQSYYLDKYFSMEFCIFLYYVFIAISIGMFIWACISMNIDNTIIKNTRNKKNDILGYIKHYLLLLLQ